MTDPHKQPSRRQHARYACRQAVRMALPGPRQIDAELWNIGLGGALLATRTPLDAGNIRLEIPSGSHTVGIEARVVRRQARDPKNPNLYFYGLAFRLDWESEPQIKALVDRLRAEMPGQDMRRDYWSI